ncbi:ATP-binding cassette domain-containing protein [Synechococcus sp. CBW1002]|uniref:ATP-binding cassette domain-containing protein n=1 Tax=unclassified Synechococcus TaxID=2626047 RepID=UPI0018CF73BA|nr:MULTISPECIES: ATP-binding cassette domain-containing protein [unclassified Synechococcus]QPN61376.1 ATP-binding cassette domain-containing protein [Synechococcus sp. CBW1002]
MNDNNDSFSQSRIQTLQAILDCTDDPSLLDQSLPERTNIDAYDALAFIHSLLAIDTTLRLVKDTSLVDLYEYNQIHLRRTSIDTIGVSIADPPTLPTLVIRDDGSHVVFFTRKGKSYTYNPYDGAIAKNPDPNILRKPNKIFEAYSHFPSSVTSPFSLLKYAFRTDTIKLLVIVFASLLVAILGLAVPWITSFLVQTVIPSSSLSLLIQSIIPATLIIISSAICRHFQSLSLLAIEFSVNTKLQTAVWTKVLKLPFKFFQKYTAADLMMRVSSISTIRQLLGNQVLLALLTLVFSAVYFVLMFTYDRNLAFVAAGVTLVSIVVTVFLIHRQSLLQLPKAKAYADMADFSYQTIFGMPQIRSTGSEPFVFKEWTSKISLATNLDRRIMYWSGLLSSFNSIWNPLGTLAIYFYLVYNFILSPGQADPKQLVQSIIIFVPFYSAYVAFNSQLHSAVSSLSSVASQAVVEWDRAKPVIFAQEEQGYSPSAVMANIKGAISFNNVSFIYENDSDFLFKELSFSVQPGSFTAITGKSGCGKTTILKLLLGLYEPWSGSIAIDGTPLSKLNIKYYRQQVGVVIQSTRLPPGSIFEIVSAGKYYTEEEVWHALKQAAIDERIQKLPMGLDTIITEVGSSISGGERQRLGIARALISKPKVLLLDEATSALDAMSQEVVSKNIRDAGCTRIVVAHRLSTIQEADQILYIEDHRLKATGSFHELVAQGLLTDSLTSYTS